MLNIGINGFGRIGRLIARALYERGYREKICLKGMNDISMPETSAHLLKYDSTHGRFDQDINISEYFFEIGSDRIHHYSTRDASQIPWKDWGVDIVLDCTGHYTEKSKAAAHLQAGARQVLISAPSPDADATVVYGVNHQVLSPQTVVVSNASCTTNALAPLAACLDEAFGIVSGLVTTVHAYTQDQQLLDANHSDIRRARAAALSMVPTKTGAAAAVGLVLPQLAGKLDGFAIRVPTPNVSVIDASFVLKQTVSAQVINTTLKAASEGALKGILAYEEQPLVSIDFNHHPASSIVDPLLTKTQGPLVKVIAWYDNEWGFANRMLDTALAMQSAR